MEHHNMPCRLQNTNIALTEYIHVLVDNICYKLHASRAYHSQVSVVTFTNRSCL